MTVTGRIDFLLNEGIIDFVGDILLQTRIDTNFSSDKAAFIVNFNDPLNKTGIFKANFVTLYTFKKNGTKDDSEWVLNDAPKMMGYYIKSQNKIFIKVLKMFFDHYSYVHRVSLQKNKTDIQVMKMVSKEQGFFVRDDGQNYIIGNDDVEDDIGYKYI